MTKEKFIKLKELYWANEKEESEFKNEENIDLIIENISNDVDLEPLKKMGIDITKIIVKRVDLLERFFFMVMAKGKFMTHDLEQEVYDVNLDYSIIVDKLKSGKPISSELLELWGEINGQKTKNNDQERTD